MTASRKEKKERALYFENAPVALLAVDVQTLRLEAANHGARAILKLDWPDCRKDIDAAPVYFTDFLSPADSARITEVLQSEDSSEETYTFVIHDSSGAIDREMDVVAHRKLKGESSVLVAIQDAAGRVRGPEQLRQSQKMESMGMLAGGIAHDFNNLLTIIAGYSQMLQGSSHLRSERDRTALEQVLKACERAADLTAQLLAFSRRQNAQPKVVDIAAIVDQTAGMLRRLIGEDIELQIHNAADTGRTYADAGQLQQLLLNLTINSRDAMPDGGTLTVSTENVKLGRDYTGQHFRIEPGNYIRLEVVDTGAGMDEATSRRVFEPFFTTKPQGKGTGLGLSTVYNIVNQIRGSIDLYSEPGHGTTFQIYLPRVQDEAVEHHDAPHGVEGGHETLMLVEDEEGVRRMVRSTLERCGYHVLLAASGPEALALIQRNEGPIDLLITDMVMPKMSGRELARRVTDLRPATPVLFISGYLDKILAATPGNPPPAFMQKPFAPHELTARVRAMLDAAKDRNDAVQTA